MTSVHLSDVITFKKGKKPKLLLENVNAGALPYILIESFEGQPSAFTDDASCPIAIPSDTLLVCDGARTGLSCSGLHGYIGSTLATLKPDEARLEPAYLLYFVRSKYNLLNSRTRGSAIPHLDKNLLLGLQLPLPPLPEQRRIVDILSRAEGIVRLRRDAEKKASELIPVLFFDMFGDPATNTKRWPTTTIGEIASYTRYGPRFPDRKYSNDGAHILRTTDMGYDGELRWFDAPILPMSGDEVEKYSLRPRTLLITRTGATIGKIALFTGANRPCIAGAYLIELGLNSTVVPDFVLHFFLSQFGQSQLVGGSRAVAQPNINAPTIRAIQMPLPDLAVQQTFGERVTEIRSIQSQQSAATAKALATFDALLSQVFSNNGDR